MHKIFLCNCNITATTTCASAAISSFTSLVYICNTTIHNTYYIRHASTLNMCNKEKTFQHKREILEAKNRIKPQISSNREPEMLPLKSPSVQYPRKMTSSPPSLPPPISPRCVFPALFLYYHGKSAWCQNRKPVWGLWQLWQSEGTWRHVASRPPQLTR